MDREQLFRQRAVDYHTSINSDKETLQPPSILLIRTLWGLIIGISLFFVLIAFIEVPEYNKGYLQNNDDVFSILMDDAQNLQVNQPITIHFGTEAIEAIILERRDDHTILIQSDVPLPSGINVNVQQGKTTLLDLWFSALGKG